MKRARRNFWKADDGLAALEFAFVLPVMLAFFLGLVEVAQAISCRADVTSMAATGSDLIAQETKVSATDLTNVFNAVTAMVFPFDGTKATVTIYSIIDNGGSSGKVDWSCIKGGTGPTTPPSGTTGGDMIKASNLDANGNPQYGGSGSVILTEVKYTYTSPISMFLVGAKTWTSDFYAKPRLTNQIKLSNTCTS